MSLTPDSPAARAYASALRMHEGDSRIPRPTPEQYAHVTPAQPAPAPEGEANASPAPTAPTWDTASFDALPSDIREAVRAGTAALHGRNMLELEAEAELARPGDVHRYITDPARYVLSDGTVDRASIRADLAALTCERPELSRFGHAPGQQPFRPDERRRAPEESAVGARPGKSGRTEVASTLQRMQQAMGVRFAQGKDTP